MSDEMKRRFEQFARHQDGTGEIISAEDINELQKETESQQRDIFDLKDVDFEEKTLFVLEHHPVVNTAFVERLSDDDNIDKTEFVDLVYSENERAIAWHPEYISLESKVDFKPIVHRKGLPIVKVLLMTQQYTPVGTSIEYQVSNNGVDYYNITPNQSNVLKIPTSGPRVYVRAIFKRDAFTKSPRLDAWSLLYEDTSYSIKLFDDYFDFGDVPGEDDGGVQVKPHYHKHSELLDIGPDDHHPQYHTHDGTDGSGTISHSVLTDIGPDDHHPKNHRHGQDGVDPVNLGTDVVGVIGYPHLPHTLWTGFPGNLYLYRNPNLEDRVVRAKSPDEDVYLMFDEEGYLDKVLTIFREEATIETMNWGNYEYADGSEMRTLMGTTKVLKDIQDEEVVEIRALIHAEDSKPPMPAWTP